MADKRKKQDREKMQQMLYILKKVIPGELRQFDVFVGHHKPPSFTEIPAYLKRLNEVYNLHRLKGSDAFSAIAASCSSSGLVGASLRGW
jgi:hypothetical protein